jgi:hypothetical protein
MGKYKEVLRTMRDAAERVGSLHLFEEFVASVEPEMFMDLDLPPEEKALSTLFDRSKRTEDHAVELARAVLKQCRKIEELQTRVNTLEVAAYEARIAPK